VTADLLTVGEALVSFRTDAVAPGWTASAHVAGAEANVAIGLARLGHRARWVGRVSTDALGDWVLATLAHEGVDVSFAHRDAERPAGAMVLEAPADHARHVTYLRRFSAGSALTAEDVLPALVGARRVHLTGVTLALGPDLRAACRALARAADAEGVPVSLDVNHRPALWSAQDAREALAGLLPHVKTVIASDDELALLGAGPEDRVVADLLAGGASEVVVKRGARGAGVFWAGGAVELPALRVRVVDVIGAGDALSAGFLSGLLDGLDRPDALARGIALAGACVAGSGDWEGLPDRDRLSELVAQLPR